MIDLLRSAGRKEGRVGREGAIWGSGSVVEGGCVLVMPWSRVILPFLGNTPVHFASPEAFCGMHGFMTCGVFRTFSKRTQKIKCIS